MPLCLRRKQLQADYWVSLMGQRGDHPVQITIQESWDREVARLPSVGWTGEAVAREMSICDKNVCTGVPWPSVPLWELEVPKIDVEVLGHTFPSSTLFILGKHQSGLCSCLEPETVQHVLMSCRKYDRQRQDLLRELQETGLKEVSLKSILEVGSSRRGTSCLFTGLYSRVQSTEVLVHYMRKCSSGYGQWRAASRTACRKSVSS